MTHRIMLLTQLAALAFAPVALAHGDGVHLMGKVQTVNEASLSLETKDGKQHTITIDTKTKVERSGVAATVRDLAVGQRVVVHARKDGEALVAQLIKLGKVSNAEHPQNPDGGTKEKEHHDHSNH